MTQLVDDLQEVLKEGRLVTIKELADAIINLRRKRGETISNYIHVYLPTMLRTLIADIRKYPERYGFTIPHVSNGYHFYWICKPEDDNKFDEEFDSRRRSAFEGQLSMLNMHLTQTRNQISQIDMITKYETLPRVIKNWDNLVIILKAHEIQLLSLIESLSK